MRSAVLLASLASLSTLAAAQGGYGRFPCTIVNGDTTLSADPSQCLNTNLVAPGSGVGGDGIQGNGPTPNNPICTLEPETGAYFCGISGAPCASADQCDNGSCLIAAGETVGICQGGFNTECNSDDSQCSGFLYCQSADFTDSLTNQCGAIGSFCQDPIAVDPSFTTAQAQGIFNNFCQSTYCSSTLGNCAALTTVAGGTCADDPDFQCSPASNLVCDLPTLTCVAAPAQSGRARARRNKAIFQRNLCPTSHTACSIEGASKGFECIDTNTNIEQCGNCASNGGVDCSALPGVEAVGCVGGQCEIWSCAEGFTWSSELSACI